MDGYREFIMNKLCLNYKFILIFNTDLLKKRNDIS